MKTNRELILEDARSIRGGLWCIAQLAQEAAELLEVPCSPPPQYCATLPYAPSSIARLPNAVEGST